QRKSQRRLIQSAENVIASVWFRKAPKYSGLQIRRAKHEPWLIGQILKCFAREEVVVIAMSDLLGRRGPRKSAGQRVDNIDFLLRKRYYGINKCASEILEIIAL